MPQRFLKPAILTSLRLARCSPWAQLLYYKLISLVDDFSRYDAHPTVVARAAFPYGDHKGRAMKEAQIETWLGELENARLNTNDEPCLTRFTANSTRFLFLHRWTERCRSENSRYPSPAEDVACWQLLSDVVKRQQAPANAASPPSSLPSSSITPKEREREREASPAEVLSSRTRVGILLGQIRSLEFVRREDRSSDQREDLKKIRAELARLQKKQAEGDFKP